MPIPRLVPLALVLCLFAVPARATDEVHWTFTGSTSVALDWRGSTAGLRYGITPAYGQTATGATPSPLPFSSAGPFWEAKISGLLPATTYHYSIANGPDHVFHTPPLPGAPFTVYCEGDIGDSATYWRVATVQSEIAAGAPDFVIGMGDLTYANDNGQACVDHHFNDVMKWSQDIAYMPAWGNHEWDKSTDDFRNYKGRFAFPNPQTSPGAPSAGCCGEDWYWFDYGNVRFIAYPEPYTGAWSDWNTHAKALMDDAQANPVIRYVVTFGHRPAYSSGYHAGDATLASYLDALGTAHSKYVLDLCGHSHDYERSHPLHGVTHVTVGTGGATLEETSGSCLYAGGCPAPSWSAFRAYHHGSLRLRFSATGIQGDAICGPSGDSGSNITDVTCTPGVPFDSFTIGTPTAVTPPSAAARIALESVRPNPTPGDLDVQLSLASPAPAAIALVDVSGRTVLRRDLSDLGPGSHAVKLTPPAGTRPGLYWLRLDQEGRTATSRVTIVR